MLDVDDLDDNQLLFDAANDPELSTRRRIAAFQLPLKGLPTRWGFCESGPRKNSQQAAPTASGRSWDNAFRARAAKMTR